MNITILGSAGQIGAYLSEYLKDKGHHVSNVDIVNGVQFDLSMLTLYSFLLLMWAVHVT